MSDNAEKTGAKSLHVPKELKGEIKQVVDSFALSKAYESQIGSLFSSDRMMEYLLQVLETHFSKLEKEKKERSH